MTEDERFDKLVVDLRKWLRRRACPGCAIAAMGSVMSELIWMTNATSEAAIEDAEDVTSRIKEHVSILNEEQDQASQVLQ